MSPASTRLTLTQLRDWYEAAVIYDVSGGKLLKGTALKGANVIDVSSLPAGVYFIYVKGYEHECKASFVKQ
ncbi:MAG: T9SS type A sorting domain-containing protein [Taibaiella sp.]|nr:T9SS type A sorting domain-containing protein [Taibaiella sp.]